MEQPTLDYAGLQPAKLDWRWLLRPIVLAVLGWGLIWLFDWAHGVFNPIYYPNAGVRIAILDNWLLLVLAYLAMHGMSIIWLIVHHVRQCLICGFFVLYLTLGILSPITFLIGLANSNLFRAYE